MKRKLLAAVVLLAVGVGATGYVLFAPTAGAAATTQYLTATATTGDVTQQASCHGHRLGELHLGARLRPCRRAHRIRRHQLGCLIDRDMDRDRA